MSNSITLSPSSQSNLIRIQVDALESQVLLFSTALEVYKADELFDQLADNGDPFPLLNALEPDEVSASHAFLNYDTSDNRRR